MLALTKKTEYALIALCHLARAGAEEIVSARDISVRHGVPLPLLMNVLKSLNQKGLLRSTRGAGGGYRLAVDTHEVSLARLIECVEGPVRLVRCANPHPDGDYGCELHATCSVRGPVLRIHKHLERFLESLTVADVAFDERYGMPVELDIHAEPLKVLAT